MRRAPQPNAGDEIGNLDFGLDNTGTIGDTVYDDVNGSGSQTGGEAGIGGVTLALYGDTDGNGELSAAELSAGAIDVEVTDASGNYLFEGLPDGDYIVVLDETTLPAGTWNQTGDPTNDPGNCSPNCDASGAATISGGAGNDDLTIDFGYQQQNVTLRSVSGTIWEDDGNHTFLVAELMPIHSVRGFISPTDFNCMGYATPAVTAAKLANPTKQVVGIIGDGAFLMTCMETLTAASLELGGVYFVFNDGELSQISQAQEIPYNRKTCTVLREAKFSGIAEATGCGFISIENDDACEAAIAKALSLAAQNKPVIVDVKIDYSKRTRFTKGIVKTNLERFTLGNKARFIGRALLRRVL